MKITKKMLLLRLQENLNEMPIKYDSEDRPSPDIERDLSTRETPFKKVNLPKDVENPNSNFEELLASKRYQEIVNNIRQYTGLPRLTPDQGTIGTLMNTMGAAQMRVQQIESRHKTRLEQLAIELVMNEMGIEEGDIVFDAKIELPDSEGFEQTSPEDMEPEEIELEKELYDELEDLTLERAKRRLINAMMAGASSKGHYMYHYATDKLIEITGDRNIVGLYGSLMSSAEAMLWQMGNRSLGLSGGGGTPQAGGKETAYPFETPPRVVARAINFPILVHELMKGTLEVVSALYGQPKDKEVASKVIELEDTLQKEIWDLRLGPAIWDILSNSFPEEVITDEDKRGMQLIFFQTIVSKPAKQFLIFMREVLSNSATGKQLMSSLSEIINGEINDFDYSLAMQEFNDQLEEKANEIDTKDFDLGFLDDLGIDLPKD
jgi:hypothetical protein